MANTQRIAQGFPLPILVNETATKQRIAPGVLVNETSNPPAAPDTLFAQSSM